MKTQNTFTVQPMFYNQLGDNIYFYMGDISFYITSEEMSIMKKNGLSHDNIMSFTYETMINKKLGDFSNMVPLFEDRFN